MGFFLNDSYVWQGVGALNNNYVWQGGRCIYYVWQGVGAFKQ